jgi:hypothetical protein
VQGLAGEPGEIDADMLAGEGLLDVRAQACYQIATARQTALLPA